MDGYEIFPSSEMLLATVYQKSYLYRVVDDKNVVVFKVDVHYNDSSIENYLMTDSTVSVDVEGE